MEHPDETSEPTRTADDPHHVDEAADTAATHDPDGLPTSDRTTGLPSVDRVLDDMAGLEDRPVDEHVAVFEKAHDELRRALDARPDS